MKIVATVGCSGSGKSTWAHQQWKENPDSVLIVGRDKIRELLYGFNESNVTEYYRTPNNSKLEKQVTLFEDTLIHDGLNLGKTVIVDATNLTTQYLERYKFFNVPVEFKVFREELPVLLERNKSRVRQVPEKVIKQQYNKLRNLTIPDSFTPVLFKNPLNNPCCWIVDIDGTVAEKGSRNAFDWKRVGEDTPIEDVCNLVVDLDRSGSNIIFCSGRDEICYDESFKWLSEVFGSMDFRLYMRPKGDMRPDWIVKEEMWRYISNNYSISGLIDDRNQVCRRARSLGLTVLQVNYGNF